MQEDQALSNSVLLPLQFHIDISTITRKVLSDWNTTSMRNLAVRVSFRADNSCFRVLISKWWWLSTPSCAFISVVTKVTMNGGS